MMCLVAIASTAQGISGRVIDEQAQPMPFANVVLVSRADSAFIAGVVTKDDGTFSISTDKQDGLLKVTSVGYTTKFLDARTGNVGDIQMQPDTQMLGEVVVKGSRPLVKMKDDALVTLGKIPGVISNHGGVEVLGRGTPLIYINGRQMRNQSELDQLSSDQIKDVEVVMTPGAKYDATVKAVIRIKTIRPVGEGFSFNSRTVAGVNHYVYGLEELNLNYRTGGLDIFGMAEYENRRSRQTNDSRQEHSIGMTYTVTSRPNSQTSDYFTTMLIGQQTDDQITGSGKVDGDDIQHIISGYYAGQTGKWSLNANADVLWQKQNSDNLTFEDATQGDDRTVTTRNDVKNRLYAAKHHRCQRHED